MIPCLMALRREGVQERKENVYICRSVNSLQKTGQYSTISKDFNNGSQYDSNPRMRNTFGNISVDYRTLNFINFLLKV